MRSYRQYVIGLVEGLEVGERTLVESSPMQAHNCRSCVHQYAKAGGKKFKTEFDCTKQLWVERMNNPFEAGKKQNRGHYSSMLREQLEGLKLDQSIKLELDGLRIDSGRAQAHQQALQLGIKINTRCDSEGNLWVKRVMTDFEERTR